MGDSWDGLQEFSIRLDRYCPTCGANKPIETHETWCPNEPDRDLKDDTELFYDNAEGDECICSWCVEGISESDPSTQAPYHVYTSAYFDDEYTGRVLDCPISEPYHAPERPAGEDWGLRDKCLGIGGAPTRATTLPTSAEERKRYPVASGVLDYFADALVAISHLSYIGNEQHNPGQPLHWNRSKSGDEADTAMRHFLERGKRDKDGVRHTVKFAWRALALLQKEIEGENL